MKSKEKKLFFIFIHLNFRILILTFFKNKIKKMKSLYYIPH